MIRVVTNNLGSGDWIRVLGHGNSVLWEGHRASVYDLRDILNIVSGDGCELIECDDQQMEQWA